MKRSFAIAAGAVACLLAAGPEPGYRLVSLDVTAFPDVTAVLDIRADETGNQRLAFGDFRIREDGSKDSTLATGTKKFGDTAYGIGLVVLLDVSPSMKGRPMAAVQKGLSGLVSRKRNQDRIAMLSFANDLRWETRWGASADAVQNALKRLETRGNGTRLYDAIDAALNEFAAEAKRDSAFPARHSILVISDGFDEGSKASLAGVTKRLRESRVRLDAVGLEQTPDLLDVILTALELQDRAAGFRTLRGLAQAGFGGFRAAATPDSLSRAIEQGMDALLDADVLQFANTTLPRDGESHRVVVENIPSGWRDGLYIKMPDPLWKDKLPWLIGGGCGALVLIIAIVMVVRKRSRPAPAPQPQVVAAAPALPQPAPKPQPSGRVRLEPIQPVNSGSTLAPPSIRRIATDLETPVEPPRPQVRAATDLAPSTHKPAPGALSASAGPYAGRQFRVSADEFWIGSADNNHLCLGADSSVSGNHACIRREANVLRLYDNGSLNGTWINGQPVGQGVAVLKPGDRIRVGQSEFTLVQ